MTAEVAILNKQAVAMATDSAVTIGGSKIFNTVNKLFALSKSQPVGLMVYSSAEIMGVPVETVVKEFRHKHTGGSFGTLEEYFNSFMVFLHDEKDKTVFSDESRTDAFVRLVYDMAVSIRRRTYDILTDEDDG